jgi:very-short-patch-repair endonuclease
MDRSPHEQEQYDAIPDEVKAMIVRKQPIKLSAMCVHHFKHAADPWADYGNSLIRPLFVTLAYKDKLRQAQWIVAERHILPVRIVMVGDNERPASQADLDAVQEQISAVANDPNLTLVVPHAFDYKFVGAGNEVLKLSNEMELIEQEILDGLMLNKALLNGEGPAYGNAQVGLMSMNERLETWRRKVAQWVEEKIFKKCAEWNDFYATGEGGQEELIYPKIIFDDLKLKDNTGILQVMQTAQSAGAISAETLVEQLGLNWDQEIERLRFEQGMNFVTSADVMNTDMNIGFGGVTGQGFTGGTNQPLTGGMGGPEMGGSEMGGTPVGGAPVGGAPDMGMGFGAPPAAAPATAPTPAPAPTAESIHLQYRFAANVMNEILHNRQQLSSYEENTYISKVDQELNQKFAVTGRSYFGEVPDDLSQINPWDHEGLGVPENYLAKKEVQAGKKKERKNIQGYNNLEKKLYRLIMSMNVPVAFYAQFEAGPSKEYTLDGAFPAIKLGIEADGEIFHNNPKKIESDRQRDINLARQGWTILRFTDREIEKQPQDVAVVIQQAMQKLLFAYKDNSLEFKKFQKQQQND